MILSKQFNPFVNLAVNNRTTKLTDANISKITIKSLALFLPRDVNQGNAPMLSTTVRQNLRKPEFGTSRHHRQSFTQHSVINFKLYYLNFNFCLMFLTYINLQPMIMYLGPRLVDLLRCLTYKYNDIAKSDQFFTCIR